VIHDLCLAFQKVHCTTHITTHSTSTHLCMLPHILPQHITHVTTDLCLALQKILFMYVPTHFTTFTRVITHVLIICVLRCKRYFSCVFPHILPHLHVLLHIYTYYYTFTRVTTHLHVLLHIYTCYYTCVDHLCLALQNILLHCRQTERERGEVGRERRELNLSGRESGRDD